MNQYESSTYKKIWSLIKHRYICINGLSRIIGCGC